MWLDALWYVAVAWTGLATLAILRHDSLTNTARNSGRAVFDVVRAWRRPAVLDAEPDPSPDDAAEDEADEARAEPSVFAARDVRVFRHRVRPRAVPIGRGPKGVSAASASAVSASAASASPASSSSWSAVRPLFAPLEFEVELQWQAPPAVLEQGSQISVTYELRLQPEDGSPALRSPASEEQQPLESGDAQHDGKEDALPQAIPPAILAAPPSAPLIHRFTMGGGGAERAVSSSARSAGAVAASSSMDLDSEESSESSHSSDAAESKDATKAARPPRKRKATSRSSSRAGGAAAAAARAPRGGRLAGLRDEEDASSGSHGTFEEPRFTLQHPRAAAYSVSVLTSAGSYAAAAQVPRPGQADCLSSPLHFSFRLPALLYLVQCVPATSAAARQVLGALERLLSTLTPRDDLRGIDWTSVRTILGAQFSSHTHKRLLALLSRLIEWRCILVDLAANADMVRALQALVDARLEHLAKKAAGERASKRARQHEEMAQQQAGEAPAALSAEQQLAVAASASPACVLDAPDESSSSSSAFVPDDDRAPDPDCDTDDECAAAVDPAAPQLLEPVLENVLWFCLKTVALHDAQHTPAGSRQMHHSCPATSNATVNAAPSIAAEDDSSLSGSAALARFVSAGGHLLLLSLVSSNTKAEWYEHYQGDVLRALANMCVCTCCGVPPADSAAILHFLVRQATFGSDEAQDVLMHSAVRTKITNPYE